MNSILKLVAFASIIPSLANSFSPVIKSIHRSSKLNLSESGSNDQSSSPSYNDRRKFITQSAATILVSITAGNTKAAFAADDGFSVDDYLKTGQVAMPMGVSGQAGKSKPETGIVFRDGSELFRDTKSGDVLTEILLNAQSDDPIAVLTSFSSPWPLGKCVHS